MDNISDPSTQLSEKSSRESDEDLISKLPDSLLQHLCSFVSTRDAVRTSLLSRRWQNLWTLVPCLDLDSEQFNSDDDFYNFMDRFLHFRGNSDLQKFKVIYYSAYHRSSARFETWIDAAIKCKVEHVEIESYCRQYHVKSDDDGIRTPQSLFICNTLVVLKLDGVDNFDIPNRVSLSNLKIMHLDDVIFTNDIAFKSLFSGCPVLEELNICRGYGDNIVVLCICSRTLKQLIISFTRQDPGREYGVVIDAPNLEYLKLKDQGSKSFIINNIGSSLKGCLNVRFGNDKNYELRENDFSLRSSIGTLFTGMCNARTLDIGLDTFELLCQYRKFEALPQFHNLIHLEAELSKDAFKVLPAILECCPNLKFLILDIFSSSECPPLRSHPVAPQPMLSSLESITLQTRIIGDAIEMNLIKYFLEKSPVLKEMKVCLSKKLNREKEFLILKKLLMFPRRSKACQFLVKQ